MQNADKDEKPSGSVSSQSLDLGFPEDEDDAHPEGKVTCASTIVIVVNCYSFCYLSELYGKNFTACE